MTRILVALVAALALVVVAAPASAAVPSQFFGVMADGPLLTPPADLGREAQLMRSSGVGSARVAFYWRDMQPDAGAPVAFAETDRIVAALARGRLEVLPILVRAPAWAAAGDEREGAVPDPDAFAAFAGAVVRRYGAGGSFWAEHRDLPARVVQRWQVWNEPDIDRYFAAGDQWPARYVALLRPARAAIKAADPHAQVVAAGLTNRSWDDLAKLYAAGARGLFDAAAIHPFSRRVANVVKIVELTRAEMRRRGDARVPLLLTELSWSSGKGRSSFNYGWETSERGQAQKVREALTALVARRTRLGIGGVWWYTWLSPPVGDDESFAYGGLRRLSGGRAVSKPALAAFKTTVQRLRSR